MVAIGTSDSEVHLFSPAEAKVVASLREAHTQGIRDFKFANDGLHAEGWSIGGDGRLVQWDLRKNRVLRLERPDYNSLAKLTAPETFYSQMDLLIPCDPCDHL